MRHKIIKVRHSVTPETFTFGASQQRFRVSRYVDIIPPMRSLLFLLSILCTVATSHAQTPLPGSLGQTLYLPIYSHIWHGESDPDGKPSKTLMSISVSFRNTDSRHPIRVTSAQYFDTDGKRLREYLIVPKTVAPLGTLELFVPRSDDTGGSGANFLITWKAEKPASPPLVQGLHANLPAGRSIAFITSSVEVPQ